MNSDALLAVYTTVANASQATLLAEAAVAKQLAACVQYEQINSTFYWNARVEKAEETRMMFKTTVAQYSALEQFLKENHPYSLPAIFAVSIFQAEKNYQDWVVTSLAEHRQSLE
jgi:periplasmic divalent cation tolerance protein